MSHAQTDTSERTDLCADTGLKTCSPSCTHAWNMEPGEPDDLQRGPGGVRRPHRDTQTSHRGGAGVSAQVGTGTETRFLSVTTHNQSPGSHTPAIVHQRTRDSNNTPRPRRHRAATCPLKAEPAVSSGLWSPQTRPLVPLMSAATFIWSPFLILRRAILTRL